MKMVIRSFFGGILILAIMFSTVSVNVFSENIESNSNIQKSYSAPDGDSVEIDCLIYYTSFKYGWPTRPLLDCDVI